MIKGVFMRKVLVFILLAVLVITLFIGCDTTQSSDGGNARFTIRNRIQSQDNIIQEVYVKRNNVTDWGPNMISVNMQANSDITITKQSHVIQAGTFDLRVRTVGGRWLERVNVLLRNGTTIEFMDEIIWIRNSISSQSGFAINQLHIKESASTNWGANLITSPINFESWGQGQRVILLHSLDSNIMYDIRATTGNGTVLFKHEIFMGDGSEVVFTTADMQDGFFTVQNRINLAGFLVEVSSIQLKLSTQSNWGSNLLHGTLPFGSDTTIILSHSLDSADRYDIRLIGNLDSIYQKEGIRINQGSAIEFTVNDMYSGYYLIINNANFAIDNVFHRLSSHTTWNSFNRSLARGASLIIFTTRGELGQNRDFRGERSTGSYIKRNVFVRRGDTVSFVAGDWILNGQLRIDNRINGYTIDQAFLRVSGTSDWGQNILSSPIISSGWTTHRTIDLNYVLEQGVTYDVRVRAFSVQNPSVVYFFRISNIALPSDQRIQAMFQWMHRE